MNQDENPLATPLRNKVDSYGILKEEKYTHRQMIALASQGFTPTEIATITGFSMIHVAKVLNQPGARDLLVKSAAFNATTDIKKIVEETAKDSVVRLATMAQDEALRLRKPELYEKVNQSFIDRYLGRATTIIEERRTEPAKLSDEELATNITRLTESIRASSQS